MPTVNSMRVNGVIISHFLNLSDDCVYVRKRDAENHFLKYDSSCNVFYQGKRIAKLNMMFGDGYRVVGYKMTLEGHDDPVLSIPCTLARDFTEAEPHFTKFLIDQNIIEIPE